MFTKKDIPVPELPGYRRFENKSGRGSTADKSTGGLRKHARGQKQTAAALQKEMQFGAR
ncbi:MULTISPECIES: hypothetical protein [Rhizobium]|uniref:hypothetical protein n=1 Tax=Rhizobium TaxID=379 RepID=UPI000AAE696A|nr:MULTISPECIES: hypothetical protein [Rhizobium]